MLVDELRARVPGGSQAPITPAASCRKNPIRPASITCIGSTITVAPAARARSVSPSRSSVEMYVDHATGWLSSWSGPTPATSLPSLRNIA